MTALSDLKGTHKWDRMSSREKWQVEEDEKEAAKNQEAGKPAKAVEKPADFEHPVFDQNALKKIYI